MIKKEKQTILLSVIVGLTLLAACSKQQRPTNKQKQVQKSHGICAQIENTYAPMIKLAETINYPQSKQEFKKQIMIHNDVHNKKRSKSLFGAQHQDLPFVQYKSLLDKKIKKLERSLKKLHKQKIEDKEQENALHELIAQLEELNRVIITSDEYHQEKLQLAGQKRGPGGIFSFGLGSLVRKLIPV